MFNGTITPIMGNVRSNIKSTQHIYTTFTSGAATKDVTIDPVDTDKTEVNISYYSAGNDGPEGAVAPTLVNAITVRLTHGKTTVTATIYVAIEVIEYRTLKSKQVGIYDQSANSTEETVTIESVDPAKTKVIAYNTNSSAGGTAYNYFANCTRLITATTLGITAMSTSYTYYQVLEFY